MLIAISLIGEDTEKIIDGGVVGAESAEKKETLITEDPLIFFNQPHDAVQLFF